MNKILTELMNPLGPKKLAGDKPVVTASGKPQPILNKVAGAIHTSKENAAACKRSPQNLQTRTKSPLERLTTAPTLIKGCHTNNLSPHPIQRYQLHNLLKVPFAHSPRANDSHDGSSKGGARTQGVTLTKAGSKQVALVLQEGEVVKTREDKKREEEEELWDAAAAGDLKAIDRIASR